jgi:hypothetical protein
MRCPPLLFSLPQSVGWLHLFTVESWIMLALEIFYKGTMSINIQCKKELMSTNGDFGCAFLDSFRARQKIDLLS